MFLTKVDLWLGKTLFVPPIIKFCQLTRQSQFAVSRLFWFVAAFDLARGAATGEWAGTEFWLFVLIAEYASTIRHVPPRETARRASEATARN